MTRSGARPPLGFLAFAGGMALLLFYSVTAGVLFARSFQDAVITWEQDIGSDVQRLYEQEIAAMAAVRGGIAPRDIDEFIAGQLDPSRYLIVFAGTGELLFWYWEGDVWLATAQRDDTIGRAVLADEMSRHRINGRRIPMMESGGDMLQRMREADAIRRLEDAGVWVAAGTTGISANEANSAIIASVRSSVYRSILFVLLLSIVLAVVASRLLQLSAVGVAEDLRAIAAGDRGRALRRTMVREHHMIAQAAMELQDTLRHEEALRIAWTHDITHDLRTPIAGMRAQLEAIRDGVFRPDSERLDRILDQVGGLESLVESLLLLTRMETPEFTPSLEPVALAEELEMLADSARARHPQRRVTVELPGDAPHAVMLDRGLIGRAVTNLLENALRYSDGDVGIRVLVPGASTLQIDVHNQGSIPEPVRLAAFDRLFRADSSRTWGEGQGLGLPIVRAIARAHGGEAYLENHAGRVIAGLRLPCTDALTQQRSTA